MQRRVIPSPPHRHKRLIQASSAKHADVVLFHYFSLSIQSCSFQFGVSPSAAQFSSFEFKLVVAGVVRRFELHGSPLFNWVRCILLAVFNRFSSGGLSRI